MIAMRDIMDQGISIFFRFGKAMALRCMWAVFAGMAAMTMVPGGLRRSFGATRTTCLECHANERKTENRSVHHAGGISCHACHGGDPGAARKERAHNSAMHFTGRMDPDDHVAMCGQCHQAVLEQFRQSPHHEALNPNTLGNVVCTDCHGHHGVAHASPVLFETSCVGCHAEDTAGYRTGEDMQACLSDVYETYHDTLSAVEDAQSEGYYLAAAQEQMQFARAVLQEMGPVSHTASVEKLKARSGKVHMALDEVNRVVTAQHLQWRQRRRGLLVIWPAVGVMVLLLGLKLRSCKDEV